MVMHPGVDGPDLRGGKAAAIKHIRSLERLARYFLKYKFADAKDIWQFQLDLLTLQKEIQKSISEAKARARHDKSVNDDLDWLRDVRWHARRLGDAFAWTLFNYEERFLFPLAENAAVAISSGGLGEQGAINIAAHLCDQGWGFPVLHDITDCLRIGDVTFIKPGADPLTVEVKTSFLRERILEGQRVIDSRVTVIYPTDRPQLAAVEEPVPVTLPTAAQTIEHPRIVRQRKRMHTARVRQNSLANEIFHLDGEPSLTVEIQRAAGHWELLKRIVRRARRSGYASESLDGMVLYFAVYSADGIDVADVRRPELIRDAQDCGIFRQRSGKGDSAVLLSVPPQEGKHGRPQLFLPFFLYPLPLTAINDILNRRLAIFAMVSTRRIVEALEDDGLMVLQPNKRHPLTMTVRIELPSINGYRMHLDVPHITTMIYNAIYEFRGLDHVLQAAAAFKKSAPISAEEAIRAMTAAGS